MSRLLLPLGLALLWTSPLLAQTVMDPRLHCTADGKICVPKAPLKDNGIRYRAAPLEPEAPPAVAHTKPLATQAPQPAHRTRSAPPPQRHAAPPKAAPQPLGPPRVGQIARNLRGFEQAKRSRFAPPPAGQAYWVVDDHLVLLRQSDRQIMAVLGLVDALIK